MTVRKKCLVFWGNNQYGSDKTVAKANSPTKSLLVCIVIVILFNTYCFPQSCHSLNIKNFKSIPPDGLYSNQAHCFTKTRGANRLISMNGTLRRQVKRRVNSNNLLTPILRIRMNPCSLFVLVCFPFKKIHAVYSFSLFFLSAFFYFSIAKANALTDNKNEFQS